MEDIDNHLRAAIPKDYMTADKDAFAIRRRGWQAAIQVNRNNDDAAFQFSRKRRANHELIFQSWRQTVPFCKSRRKMPVMVGIPAADLVTIAIGETVSPPVLVIIVVSSFISPVAIIMITVLMIGKYCAP